MSTTDWMRNLPDNKWLRQIVMPGSHDAGVWGTQQVILRMPSQVKKEYTVCQHSDFAKQAMAGSRFFDCRVFFRKRDKAERVSPDQKYENRLGHFALERKKIGPLPQIGQEPTMGGYGGALAAVVTQALDFVIGNPSEFVILRFSHTFHPTECVAEIKGITSQTKYRDAVYKKGGNLATTPIRDLRGKVLMVFDEKFNHHITPAEGILRFRKYSDGSAHIDGLATCGDFKAKFDMKDVHKVAAGAVKKHLDHPPDQSLGHLHFVYWQQTAGLTTDKDVFKTTVAAPKPGKAYSGGAQAHIADFVQELQAAAKGRLPVNVFSHDFVTADSCTQIIRMNPECQNP